MLEQGKQFSREDAELGLTPEADLVLRQAKPEVVVQPQFQAALRGQLLAQVSDLEQHLTKKESWFMTWKQFSIGFGTALAAVVLVWYAVGGISPLGPKNATELLSGEYKVTEVEANSFGSLAMLTSAESQQGGENVSRPQSGGGSENFAVADLAQSAPGSGGGGDAKMIAPYPENQFVFSYEGGDLPELALEQPVFKRVKELDSNPSQSILGLIRLGLFNLQKLVSPNVENLSLSENRDRGYSLNINFLEGSLGLYEDWRTWRLPERECQDEACYNRYKLTPDQIPADEDIIAIASTFLADYGISNERYGSPQVQDYWRQEYAQAVDKSVVYIPDTINVVYPFIVDGKLVYDEGGGLTGLNVSVNVRHRVVSSVFEVTTQQYSKSNYAGFTDKAAIIKLAEQGGFRNYFGPMPLDAANSQIRTTTIKLGTPKIGIMRIWTYSTFRPGDELYVPTLVFPVTNKNQASYYRDNVLVPLVKEIIENEQQPPYMIMEKGTQDAPVENAAPVLEEQSDPGVRVTQ